MERNMHIFMQTEWKCRIRYEAFMLHKIQTEEYKITDKSK
jgi:hypothetical protein